MKKIIIVAMLLFAMASCGGGSGYKKTALDTIIQSLDQQRNFTVLLYDMNVEGSFSKEYFHKYKIVTPGKGEEALPKEEVSEWYKVSEREFDTHVNNLGMEVAAKTDGKLTKSVSPPGYSNYVGNSQYGQWRSGSNGTSFWEFYGQYAFMSSMFGLMSGPIYRNSYTDWRTNYYGSRPYYGRTVAGAPSYGTMSTSARRSSPSYYSRAQTNSALKNTVNNKISRSSTSSSSKTGRSDSRYSSGSSTKSRSFSRGGK